MQGAETDGATHRGRSGAVEPGPGKLLEFVGRRVFNRPLSLKESP